MSLVCIGIIKGSLAVIPKQMTMNMKIAPKMLNITFLINFFIVCNQPTWYGDNFF